MLLQCPPAEARRAVIDIGSNSIRLVVYPAGRRVPAPLINEKVSAKLGKTLQEDGRLPEKAMEVALRGLARFATIVAAIGVDSVAVVATAAVRDAANGPEFLQKVRDLGLAPALLTGDQEAAASARGVICAFPEADGVVADLGGGSLELIEVADGKPGAGVTLPLGTLRLARMRAKDPTRALSTMRSLIERSIAPAVGSGRALYVVGGSWRALAQFAIQEIEWPVRNPHGFTMSADEIAHLVAVLAHTPRSSLDKIPGVSASRLPTLGDAAIVLSALVRHLRPREVVTSSFGLREGLIFDSLPGAVQRRDPLIADLEDQLGEAAGGSIYGEPLHRWADEVFPDAASEATRIRLAASWLGLPARRPERALRRSRALELAFHERWIGIDAKGRVQLAAALLAFVGERAVPAQFERLCDGAILETAMRWGSVMRFAEKLSVGSAPLLDGTSIAIRGSELALRIPPGSGIYGEAAEQQHRVLAARLGLAASVRSV